MRVAADRGHRVSCWRREINGGVLRRPVGGQGSVAWRVQRADWSRSSCGRRVLLYRGLGRRWRPPGDGTRSRPCGNASSGGSVASDSTVGQLRSGAGSAGHPLRAAVRRRARMRWRLGGGAGQGRARYTDNATGNWLLNALPGVGGVAPPRGGLRSRIGGIADSHTCETASGPALRCRRSLGPW